ncbi:WD and tetratricopeptide repeats protein [Dirofilaria immitis]
MDNAYHWTFDLNRKSTPYSYLTPQHFSSVHPANKEFSQEGLRFGLLERAIARVRGAWMKCLIYFVELYRLPSTNARVSCGLRRDVNCYSDFSRQYITLFSFSALPY